MSTKEQALSSFFVGLALGDYEGDLFAERNKSIKEKKVFTSRRRMPIKPVVEPVRQAPRKHGGMGGHMTASLLWDMKKYDDAMLRSDKKTYNAMQEGRAHYMKRIMLQLNDRGYYGPFPVKV